MFRVRAGARVNGLCQCEFLQARARSVKQLLRYSTKVTCCCRAASLVRYLAICEWCVLSCALHPQRAKHGGAPSKFASMAGCMMIPPTTTRLGTSPAAPAASRHWPPPPGRWPPPTPRPLPAAPHAEPARRPAHSAVKTRATIIKLGLQFLHALTKLVRPQVWSVSLAYSHSPALLACFPKATHLLANLG